MEKCCICGRPADGVKDESGGTAYCAEHGLDFVRGLWEGPLSHCWDLGLVSFGRHGLSKRHLLARDGKMVQGEK
jgi:hypothetical protein